MPKEYLKCVESEISRGRKKKDAQRICAIRYYKLHGRTPQQDEKASLSQYELDLFTAVEAVDEAFGAKMRVAHKNDLPDSAFLYVEPGGKKDESGKTVPRSKRHLPYKNAGGGIDLPHLRNAIARLEQSNTGKGWLTPELRARLLAKARRLLKSHGGNPKEPKKAKK